LAFRRGFGGARRDEEKSRAKKGSSRTAPPRMPGIRAINGLNSGSFSTPGSNKASRCGCFPCPTGPSSMSGLYFAEDIPSCRSILPRSVPSSSAAVLSSWSMTSGSLVAGRGPRVESVRFRTLAAILDRAIRSRAANLPKSSGNARFDDIGAGRPSDRPRRIRLDGKEKAGRLFLMLEAVQTDLPLLKQMSHFRP